MKTLSLVMMIVFLSLAACAPKSGSDSQKTDPTTEEGRSSDNNGGSGSGSGNGGASHGGSTNKKYDCGAQAITNCNLFGLSNEELMQIRASAHDVLSKNYDSLKTDASHVLALRSASLLIFVAKKYPHADLELNTQELEDYTQYLTSALTNN